MEFDMNVFDCFMNQALLGVGDKEHFNAMTIGWGALGTMWGKPSCTVYVRHSRYTHELLEDTDIFTVSFFDPKYKKNMVVYGQKSGRDTDKEAISGFTLEKKGEGVGFKEAKKTLVCRKLYKQTLDTNLMPQDIVEKHYPNGDVHDMYIAEVLEIID